MDDVANIITEFGGLLKWSLPVNKLQLCKGIVDPWRSLAAADLHVDQQVVLNREVKPKTTRHVTKQTDTRDQLTLEETETVMETE